jgi:hypothetical protein
MIEKRKNQEHRGKQRSRDEKKKEDRQRDHAVKE